MGKHGHDGKKRHGKKKHGKAESGEQHAPSAESGAESTETRGAGGPAPGGERATRRGDERKEAARTEKQRRKEAARADLQREEAARAEKRRRKDAEREEKQRRKATEREEKQRRKEEERAEERRRKEAKRRGEPAGDAPVGVPHEPVVAEEMAQATAAAGQSLEDLIETSEGFAPEATAPRARRKRGIPDSAHERRHSTAGEHGASEVEVRARRGGHKHVDLFDAFESIHWREFKILLKAEDFSDDLANDVADYWRLARRVAGQLELSIRRSKDETTPRLREIVFLDTPDFDLYRNSYMLRMRRDILPDGPAREYELTLKFRDSDVGKAHGIDPKPAPGVSGVMKFKEEILLVSTALGGMRSIFSHTCQLKAHREPPPRTVGESLAIFPMLERLGLAPETPVAPAVDTPVEEVLYDLGEIGFRGSKTAKVDMAIWRNAQTKKILIGEFAYETHFRHYGRLNPVPKLRSERLYRLLQRETGAWVELGNTKTWLYYGLSGRKVHDE
ncbi:MAG: hypothetical protein ACKPBU_08810 [Alphaproteobacteria bacterium]